MVPNPAEQLHQQFLSDQRVERRKVLFVQILILVLFLGLWEAAGRLKWIDVLLFSYPSKITALIWSNTMY